MGANEKHEATYHGGEYVPSIEDVREVWGGFSEYGGLVTRPSRISADWDYRYAEFDRWIEIVRAEAKAEALEEAAREWRSRHSLRADFQDMSRTESFLVHRAQAVREES